MPCPCILTSGERKGSKCGRRASALTTGQFCGYHQNCKHQEYETAYNGGTSFIVRDYGKKVKVYEPIWNQSGSGELEMVDEKYIMEIPYIKMMIHMYTILLKISTKEYILISGNIVQIKTDEEIKEFFAPEGGSGVPYPYAISDNYLYDLSDFFIYNKKQLPKQVLQQKGREPLLLDVNVQNNSVGQIESKTIYTSF